MKPQKLAREKKNSRDAVAFSDFPLPRAEQGRPQAWVTTDAKLPSKRPGNASPNRWPWSGSKASGLLRYLSTRVPVKFTGGEQAR